ncbi:MAG: hypothetical protein VBE63_11495 [Lamprobacter sp.]|uniref:hypothetical protein n=1 Tax=Lamprobacter sp. TaxID=3100796 RepID=UPI002B259EA1|nr:hypothetical protein [Lamprobacter sp.]MEA3640553.1 hypothetical protein [Lamprobacter sp.]
MHSQSNAPLDVSAFSAAEALAHALELTHDSAARYAQLQACLEAHHNQIAADLLGLVVELTLTTASSMPGLQPPEQLPRIAPWELVWRCPDLLAMRFGDRAPSACHHQIGGAELLRLVLRRERCAHSCFANAREQVASTATQQMLSAIATRQQEQIARLEALLASAKATESEVPPRLSDLDPPNRPE